MEKRDHTISLAQKDEYVQRFTQANKLSKERPGSFRFDARQVSGLVFSPDAEEFVVTKGLTPEGDETVVLSVLDADGKAIGHALELAFPCPPDCH